MAKGKRNRAEREARQIAHAHTQREEGRWLGELPAGEHPVATRLIERYNAAAESGLRRCPELGEEWDQPRFWLESVPELIACKQCTPALAAEESKRANTCCVMCGAHVELRGLSVVVGPVLLRGGVCEACENKYGGLIDPPKPDPEET